jgi:hypothetical protein
VVVLLSPWGLAGGGLLGCATSKSQGCTRQCLPPTVSHLGPPGSAHQPCGTATIGCSLTAVRCAPKGLDISSGTWMTKTPPHDFCVSGCFATYRVHVVRWSCACRPRFPKRIPRRFESSCYIKGTTSPPFGNAASQAAPTESQSVILPSRVACLQRQHLPTIRACMFVPVAWRTVPCAPCTTDSNR